jgi:hypothetical protein
MNSYKSVILSEASRSLIARGAVEGPAFGSWRQTLSSYLQHLFAQPTPSEYIDKP